MVVLFSACADRQPNQTKSGENLLESHEIENQMNSNQINYDQEFYVPIYSNIYVDNNANQNLTAATLSIRNTSHQDSIFVSKIDYYNTDGTLVRQFIDQSIGLRPMSTLNYVIEREDDAGGAGANFIVQVYSKNASVQPLIQAVMIGQFENKAYSFSTDGYPINQ